MVSYENGVFSFPKLAWGSSKQAWLTAFGLTEKDITPLFDNKGYASYRTNKRIVFEEPPCSGYLLCNFYEDALVSADFMMSNSYEIPGDEGDYPDIDLKAVRSYLADRLENSSIPAPGTAGGVTPLREDIQNPNVSWWSGSHIVFQVSGADNIETVEVFVAAKRDSVRPDEK